MKLRCDNCGRIYAADDELACVFPDIPDLLTRIEPGGAVPHGECSNCGCLVYNEPEPEMRRCVVCGDRMDVNGFRDHLESHHPNAAGMDWEDVQAQFVRDATGKRPAMVRLQPTRRKVMTAMRVAIVMEGALVQQVLADTHGCAYAILDRDTQGVEPDRLRADPADRRVCTIETGKAGAERKYVAAVFAAAGVVDPTRSRTKPDPLAVLANIVAAHDSWRDCSDMREALSVWSDSLKKARRLLARLKVKHREAQDHV